jgi:hypothetical protein
MLRQIAGSSLIISRKYRRVRFNFSARITSENMNLMAFVDNGLLVTGLSPGWQM